MIVTTKKTYEYFCQVCPWYKDDIAKYKSNKEGGIDIFLNDGTILNFQVEKRGNWILKRVSS